MTHKHHCPHGSWTCNCDIANGKSTCGACGTCLRIGMDTHNPLKPRVADRRHSGKSPIADKPVKLVCTLCDAEFEPALCPVRAIPLCDECVKKIEDQLTKGRFLG